MKEGLFVLLELAEKLYQLQNIFDFRHRDLRLSNIMLTSSTLTGKNIRIIDFGKASIVFENQLFSAYPGYRFENVRSDFDLGYFFADMLIVFACERNAEKLLGMYEQTLRHFCKGIEYRDLIMEEHHLQTLMKRVHKRPATTRHYSTPLYVFQTLKEQLSHYADAQSFQTTTNSTAEEDSLNLSSPQLETF